MTVGSALREFGGFLDEIERAEPVKRVRLTGTTRSDADRITTLTADVELALSTAPSNGSAASNAEAGSLALAATTVDSSGRLRLSFESVDSFLPATGDRITVDPGDVTVADSGSLVVVLTVSVRTDDATDASRAETVDPERTDGGDVVRQNSAEGPREGRSDDRNAPEPIRPARDRDVPPFRDYELLEAVYESCETFAEMVDELGMDVSAETVRRYMIDAGVHHPTSYDTGETADGDADIDAPTDDTDIDAPIDDPDTDAPTDDTDIDAPTDDTDTDAPTDDTGTDVPTADTDAETGVDASADAAADAVAVGDTAPGPGTSPPSGEVGPRDAVASDRGTVLDPAGTTDRTESGGRPTRTQGAAEVDGDGETETSDSPVVLTDGIGLPNDVTVERLIETVKRSGTVYEVTRDVGIDRDDAIDMLRELNLLDLVAGRLATEAERDISRDEVIERLREASATQ